MKTGTSICSLLGVTEHEIASLLHITRSQWSMYALGRGKLPPAATQLLAALLTRAKASQVGKNKDRVIPNKPMKLKLERLLRENEYQRELTVKKIGIAEKKLALQMRIVPLIAVLEKKGSSQLPGNTEWLNMVRKKASDTMEVDAALAVFQLQLKQQLLEVEKELLENKLREIELPS